MTSTTLPFRALLLSLLSLMTIMRAASLYAADDVRGRWSGTFTSNHSGVAPFTITVVISANSRGRLVGDSTLTSHCLKGAQLQVTVMGSDVVLAGSDKAGDNMTLRGLLDSTSTLLKSTYVLNGSATGDCETDDGTGTLTKQ
jgi:nitrous oxidase accessory protein NosD